MIRSKPKFTYCGLTIVMSQPSRFDLKCQNLLSANGGALFASCLYPEFNIHQCDIRIKEDKSALLPNTKCILLLGEGAMKSWLPSLADNTLGQVRGSVYSYENIPCVASFSPQDCVDLKDYEGQFNPYANNGEDVDGEDTDEKSRHGKTQRKNYGFWLDRDIMRIKLILANKIPTKPVPPIYNIRPNSVELIHELITHKNEFFYFDIETDLNRNILCFAFSFGRDSITVIPFLDYNYNPAYSNLHLIFRAMAVAIRDNTAVAHNGAGFDFMVLAHKYKIPIGASVYDTMIAQHRIFPDPEKSLGHCTSMWTWETYHKDEAEWGYRSPASCNALWKYCGKDVFTMILIHQAQVAYAKRVPGLMASINQANAAIKPYITCMLQGIRYEQHMIAATMKENDALMMQYIRCIKLLIGEKAVNYLRTKSKKNLPGSNNQCVEYFHKLLGYDIVSYGKEKKDGSRGPSLAKGAMFKLRMKYPNNAVIPFVLAYRELAKESGSLKFAPWTGENEYYEP